MLHVHIHAQPVQDAVDHLGHIVVDDAQAAHTHAGQRHIRQVHAVFDVAIAQVVIQLPGGHDGAAVLALRGAGTQVGHGDHVGRLENGLVGEVGDVFAYLTAFQGFGHGFVVHHLGPALIQDADTGAHLLEGGGVQQVMGAVGIRDVEADIIAVLENLIDAVGVENVTGQLPGGVDGHEGVIAIDGHAQVQGGVGHQGPGGAQADDAQGLAQQLRPGEVGLALLHQGGDLLPPARDGLHPLNAAQHVPGGQHHGADLLLLHGFGVGAGAVKDRDAMLGAGLHGDVVGAGPGPADGQQLGRKGVIVQVGAADQQGLGPLHIRAHMAALFLQHLNAGGGDGVHGLYLKHGLFQTPSYSPAGR